MATVKKVVVIGASENPERYAYKATVRLSQHGHEVIPIGIEKGSINGINIVLGKPDLKDIDTVTLYINPRIQREYYDYIIKLKPRRVIFNPGAENQELVDLITQQGIEPVEACTLVMLSTQTF